MSGAQNDVLAAPKRAPPLHGGLASHAWWMFRSGCLLVDVYWQMCTGRTQWQPVPHNSPRCQSMDTEQSCVHGLLSRPAEQTLLAAHVCCCSIWWLGRPCVACRQGMTVRFRSSCACTAALAVHAGPASCRVTRSHTCLPSMRQSTYKHGCTHTQEHTHAHCAYPPAGNDSEPLISAPSNGLGAADIHGIMTLQEAMLLPSCILPGTSPPVRASCGAPAAS